MLRLIKEYHTIPNKPAIWGAGEWCNEPDKAQYIHEETNLDCLIVRNCHMGNLCGYVGIPPGHPYYGLSYDHKVAVKNLNDIDASKNSPIDWLLAALDDETDLNLIRVGSTLQVHGSITFSHFCNDEADQASGICHLPEPGRPGAVWWFGFDCAHHEDLVPSIYKMRLDHFPDHLETFRSDVYRNFAYVKNELEELAARLKKTASLELVDNIKTKSAN